MALKAYIVTGDEHLPVEVEGVVVQETLAGTHSQTAAQVGEILDAIAETVRPHLQASAELTLEISGSATLKGEGGLKWLLISVGGGVDKTNAFKIILKTTLLPPAT